VRFPPALKALGVAGTAAGEDFLELVPVQRAVLPLFGVLVVADLVIREGEAQDPDLLRPFLPRG